MPERPFALVRRPAETLADGIVTFIERQPVDLELAKRQWDGYVAALHRSGWPTVVVEGDDAMPDCVFVEDVVVMFGDLAVVTNPRQPTRNPETVAVQRVSRLEISSRPRRRGRDRQATKATLAGRPAGAAGDAGVGLRGSP